MKKSYVRDRRPSMKNLLIFESKIYFFTNTIALMPPFFSSTDYKMINRIIPLASLLSLASLLQGALERDMPKLKSMTSEQFKSPEWVNEIQLSGTFRLGGKGFASLTTPRGNFWVEEGKFSSGYKLIELDTSQSQPSALIQKGDQQAWIGVRSVISSRTREVGTGNLTWRGGLYYACLLYTSPSPRDATLSRMPSSA